MPAKKQKSLVIAIDGPAASGKGLLARKLAQKLGLPHLDTGKLYRATGYRLWQTYGGKNCSVEALQGLLSNDPSAAVKAAKSVTIEDTKRQELESEDVGAVASMVSAIPAVRAALLALQRNFAASPEGAVLDGRDIGTVVCPKADYKFFITADLETRAMRRFKELQSRGDRVIYASVLEDLRRRDARDSQRAIAPMRVADDAVVLDTSAMSPEEVLENVTSVVMSSASGQRYKP